MRGHKLKCWPEQFRAIKAGDKTCEIRRMDRDFKVRDYLMLMEFAPSTDSLTGKWCLVEITHIHRDHEVPRGLVEGFGVLSIDLQSDSEAERLTSGDSILGRIEWIAAAGNS